MPLRAAYTTTLPLMHAALSGSVDDEEDFIPSRVGGAWSDAELGDVDEWVCGSLSGMGCCLGAKSEDEDSVEETYTIYVHIF